MPTVTLEFDADEVKKLIVKGLETDHGTLLKGAGITKPDINFKGSGQIDVTQEPKKEKK